MRSDSRPSSDVGPRAAVIVVVAVVAGAATGVLTYLSDPAVAQALLAGGSTAGGTARLLIRLFPARRPSLPDGGGVGRGEQRDGGHPEPSR